MLKSFKCLTIYAIIAFCFCSNKLHAQYSDFSYKVFGLDQGLPSNSVYQSGQDSKGNIWIGTQTGLSKYNGYGFKTYTSKNGLFQNEVVNLYVDGRDRVWLSTTGPLCYVYQDSVYKLDEFPPPNIAWNFMIDEDKIGNLWINYLSKTYYVDGNDLSIISEITTDSKRRLLMGQVDQYFLIYDGKNILRYDNEVLVDSIPFSDNFPELLFTREKMCLHWPHLLVVSENKLKALNLENQETKIVLEDASKCRSIGIENNQLIINKITGGITVYTLSEDLKLSDKFDFLENTTIGTVTADRDHNLWVPTYRSGIYLLKPISDKIITQHSLLNEIKFPLECLDAGKDQLWMGGANSYLYKYDGDKLESHKSTSSHTDINRILDINALEKDKVLVAGDFGLSIFNNGEFQSKYAHPSKKIDTDNGKVMVSAYNSVFSVDLNYLESIDEPLDRDRFYKNEKVDIVDNLRSYSNMYANGKIWYSTEREGLIQVSDGKKIRYGELSHKLKSSIKDIISIDDRTIATASSGEGIIILQKDKSNNNPDKMHHFISITSEQGLSSDVIDCLTYANGKLYAGTNNGLNIIKHDSAWEKFSIEIIDRTSGLPTNEVNDIVMYNDTLYLATLDGLVIINDNIEKTNSKDLTDYYIEISETRVNNERVLSSELSELEAYQNNMTFSYNAIDPSNSSSVGYAYRLIGDNQDDWIYTLSRETRYTNLPAGKYRFEVGLASNNDEEIQHVNSIDFEINQAFRDSFIFKLIIGLLSLFAIGSLIFLFISNTQRNKLKRLVAMRTKALDSRMVDLKEANSKLEKSNEMLKNYTYIASHDLKSPLRSIGSFIQLLSKKNKDKFDERDTEYIGYVNKGVLNMQETIDDLLDYSSLDKEEPTTQVDLQEVVKNAIFSLSALIDEKGARVNMEGYFPTQELNYNRILRVFQNLIENGLKYNESDKPCILIRSEKEGDSYTFSVSDNGIGIEKQYSDKIFEMFQRLHNKAVYTGTGIGLALCKRIVESYGGKIWIEPNDPQGTVFYINLPSQIKG